MDHEEHISGVFEERRQASVGSPFCACRPDVPRKKLFANARDRGIIFLQISAIALIFVNKKKTFVDNIFANRLE